MARNFSKLQNKMDPVRRAENVVRVREELRRMAIDELRNARRLTQMDMAEMLEVPQSSISRIEQRADMYLSTLRDYVHAVGGVLQLQAVFPDGGTVALKGFGEYDDQSYVVRARALGDGKYRLEAQPLEDGIMLSTKALKGQAFARNLKALHLSESQVAAMRKSVGETSAGVFTLARKVFGEAELIAAGFEMVGADSDSPGVRLLGE